MNALPADLQANPRLANWLGFEDEGLVSVHVGKVELGQGIATALAQIAATELGVVIDRIRMVPAGTGHSPNEGVTAGSLSVQESGAALRLVCAEARRLLVRAAAGQWGMAEADLRVRDGRIVADDAARETSYWALPHMELLARDYAGLAPPGGLAPAAYVGVSAPRLDLPDKVLGRPRFIHDIDLPGMLHGRVARPPSPAAQLRAVDLAAIEALPGVLAVVRDGRFLGLVADDEYRAEQALDKLIAAARWDEAQTLPDAQALPGFLRAQPRETTVYAEQAAAETPSGATRRFDASYARPYLAHASIAPSCALARWAVERLQVWTHSQGIFNLRKDLALMLDLPPEHIMVQHLEGAGCYGHNGADDAAADAALLARAVPGRPVRVQWRRADELAWAPFGAAMAVDLTAEVDGAGRIVRWRHEVWSNGHSSRPGRAAQPVLLAATHREQAPPPPVAINMPRAVGGGAERNSIPLYDFAQWQALSHRLLAMPLRTSSLRSLGAHCNVFATESFMDEIATALGEDALDFRLRHLGDARARAVLEAAARMAGWRARVKAPERGLGLAVSRYKNTGAYCAVAAAVEVAREVRVEKLWIAVDVGLAVNPDGVRNQIEGGALQTVSWVLKEAVRFDRTRVTSNSWEDYPILRFAEAPAIEIELLERPQEPPLGAGEAAQGPVAAALANALADALGARVRQMPFTAEALTATLLRAG